MSNLKLERETQNWRIALFQKESGYRYLVNWEYKGDYVFKCSLNLDRFEQNRKSVIRLYVKAEI